MSAPRYQRVLLKLSGEALLPADERSGLGLAEAAGIAAQIREIVDLGVQVGVVVGAGNIFRGGHGVQNGMDRVMGDNIGMLGTVINSLALHDALLRAGVPARVLTAFPLQGMAEPFSARSAQRWLQEGSVVIAAGGTGNPFFTTDTAAALRALEMKAGVLLKATKVDGVYDADPKTNAQAKRYERLTHLEVLQRRIAVMDLAAISMCMEARLPIVVFDLFHRGNLKRAVMGEQVGTTVYAE